MMVRLALAGALLATSGAAWAEAIVVRATGAAANDYAPRTRLADDAVIRLRGPGTVTVLTRGGTRTFRGPGAFPLGGSRRAAGSVFASAGARDGTAQAGATRTGSDETLAPPPPPPPTPPQRGVWQISTEANGTMCYIPAQPVSLWRSIPSGAAQITITRLADNVSATIVFTPGQQSHAWPAELAVAPGTDYRVERRGADEATQLRFVALDSDPAQPIEMMDDLLAQGCEAQVDVLVESGAEGGAAG